MRAIVTAGGSGLGRAIVARLAKAGWAVGACDIDAESVDALAAACPGVHARQADVAGEADVAAFMGSAVEAIGGLDLLVNNAGVAGPRGAVEDISPEAWRRCLDVNLTGAFLCAREAARVMKAQRAGCIVNISTASLGPGMVNRSAYIAAKAGLEGFTRALARELGPAGVRVNAIRPGLLNNERARAVLAAAAEERGVDANVVIDELLSFISMRTWIEPEEVADLVQYLAGPQGRHVTGQCIGVCGNLEWEA